MELNRILAAFYPIRVGGCKFFVQQALDWDFLCEADEVCEDFKYENRFSLLTKQQIKIQLVRRGIVPPSIDQDLSKFSKQVQKYQEELYENYDNPQHSKRLRQRIKGLRSGQDRIINLLGRYYSNSLEDKGEYMRLRFVIENTLYDKNMNPVQHEDIDVVIGVINSLHVNSQKIRKISRTDPWRTLWTVKKGAAFQYTPLTNEQSALASYSRFYDNVFKSPECPNDLIINDDDLLDGWYLKQTKGSVSQSTKTTAAHKHGEVFEMVQSKEELDNIIESNHSMNMARMKIRDAQIKKAGNQGLQHSSLNDVRMTNAQR